MPSLTCPGLPCPAQGTDDDSPTDWASILFFAGAVLFIFNFVTLSLTREWVLTQYFTSVTDNPCDKGQLETVTGGMGALSGSIVMLALAVFCNGPPSDHLMYSAVRLPNPTPFLWRVRYRHVYQGLKRFFLSRSCA